MALGAGRAKLNSIASPDLLRDLRPRPLCLDGPSRCLISSRALGCETFPSSAHFGRVDGGRVSRTVPAVRHLAGGLREPLRFLLAARPDQRITPNATPAAFASATTSREQILPDRGRSEASDLRSIPRSTSQAATSQAFQSHAVGQTRDGSSPNGRSRPRRAVLGRSRSAPAGSRHGREDLADGSKVPRPPPTGLLRRLPRRGRLRRPGSCVAQEPRHRPQWASNSASAGVLHGHRPRIVSVGRHRVSLAARCSVGIRRQETLWTIGGHVTLSMREPRRGVPTRDTIEHRPEIVGTERLNRIGWRHLLHSMAVARSITSSATWRIRSSRSSPRRTRAAVASGRLAPSRTRSMASTPLSSPLRWWMPSM